MAVKLTSGAKALFPLTSPPPKPTPEPDKALIAKVVSYGDREIIVTIPFPDSIELVAGITNDILDVPDLSGKSAKLMYSELDLDIQQSLVEIAMILPSFVKGGVNLNKTKAEFFIQYDAVQPLNKGRLLLWRTKKDDFGSWSVRLEFSPAKAGAAGLQKLIEGIEAALPFLSSAKLLQSFRIARLDGAIDCIGASPLDLIAHVLKPGKRMVFVGDHGRPESVYFFERKEPLKKPPANLSVRTWGPQRLTLYERRDYHLQLLMQPPYGPCPVTRAEVTGRWTKNRPLLSQIASVPNLFVGRRVAYAAAVLTGQPKRWRQFCLAAFGGGVEKSLWSWIPGSGLKFAKAYSKCPGDLIDALCWDRWLDGLNATGLTNWIKVAEEKLG